jgi:hypothetical protein
MTIRKGERRGTTMIDRRPVNQTGARKATGSYFTKISPWRICSTRHLNPRWPVRDKAADRTSLATWRIQ